LTQKPLLSEFVSSYHKWPSLFLPLFSAPFASLVWIFSHLSANACHFRLSLPLRTCPTLIQSLTRPWPLMWKQSCALCAEEMVAVVNGPPIPREIPSPLMNSVTFAKATSCFASATSPQHPFNPPNKNALVSRATFADSIWMYASATRPTKTHHLFSLTSRDLLCGRQLCRLLLEHQTFPASSLFAVTLPSRRTTNASYSFPPPPHATKSTTITYLKRDSTSYSM
jgi:hypothetical protein